MRTGCVVTSDVAAAAGVSQGRSRRLSVRRAVSGETRRRAQKVRERLTDVPSRPASRRQLWEDAANDRMDFWAKRARELLWTTDFSEVLDWSKAPFAQWFVGGTLNVTVNCVDRHVAAGKGGRVAIHWVGEHGDRRDITYGQLLSEVGKAANYLDGIGLRAGDRVAICMPMIPEAVVAMLACARLGLVHVLVDAASSAATTRLLLDDSRARLVITADGHFRGGVAMPLKGVLDEALAHGDAPRASVERIVVVRRTGDSVESTWVDNRDVWWHDAVGSAGEHHDPGSFDAEHPLFLFYPSFAEGKPRGIVHTSGGYLTQARYTFRFVFGQEEDADVFWCDTELATIAGHTYQVYGPLSAGATSVIYEGGADLLDERRHVRIIADYGVTTYYVAPNAVRTFVGSEPRAIAASSLTSLRLVGTLGEPHSEPARRWCRDILGGERCPVAVTWWQEETGTIVVAPLPGASACSAGSSMSPLPGISAHIVDDEADLVVPGENGHLVMDRPWPSMARGIWGDDDRFIYTYWRRFTERCWYYTGVDAHYGEDDAIRLHDVPVDVA